MERVQKVLRCIPALSKTSVPVAGDRRVTQEFAISGRLREEARLSTVPAGVALEPDFPLAALRC